MDDDGRYPQVAKLIEELGLTTLDELAEALNDVAGVAAGGLRNLAAARAEREALRAELASVKAKLAEVERARDEEVGGLAMEVTALRAKLAAAESAAIDNATERDMAMAHIEELTAALADATKVTP